MSAEEGEDNTARGGRGWGGRRRVGPFAAAYFRDILLGAGLS